MKICVVTLFPDLIGNFMQYGIPRKAVSGGQLSVETVNPRDFATDTHRTVDDRPFGGGPGMVMKVEPLRAALHEARKKVAAGDDQRPVKTVYLSPQGERFSQEIARRYAAQGATGEQSEGELSDVEHEPAEAQNEERSLVLLAGRYEGIDERLIEIEIDSEWSIGDYVLSGGEAAALVVIDSIARLLPGVLGCADSADQDSFDHDGLLDCPHYTRPERLNTADQVSEEYRDVPDVLLSGDHKKISEWRRRQSLQRTLSRRPDLLKDAALTASDKQWLATLKRDS